MSAERHNYYEVHKDYGELIPISEIEINRERANVLCSLTGFRDSEKKIPEYIVQQMLSKRRVGFIGGSGNGKTTVLVQARIEAAENAKRLKIPFTPKVEFYDNFMPQRKNGIEDLEFNKKLYNAFKKADIFENPGIGYKNPKKDRGVSALEWMMLDMMEQRDNTFLVFITSNPKIQLLASYLRSQIAETPVGEVFNELKKMKVNLKGFPKTLEIAERLKATYGNMGKLNEMRVLNDEQKNLVYEWIEHKSNTLRFADGRINHSADYFEEASADLLKPPSLNTEDIMEMFKSLKGKDKVFYGMMAASMDNKSKEFEKDRLKEGLYMEDKFRNVWGLSEDQAMIVHNNYYSKEIELDFSVFANQT